MKKLLLFPIILSILLSTCLQLSAQVSISPDNSNADPSAMLDVKSTNRGVVLPRMTFEQRNAITNPVEGLMVFCTNCKPDGTGALSMFQDGIWGIISFNCFTPNTPTSGSHIPSVTQIIWNWNSVPIAQGYKWNTINDYASATDMGNGTSKTETGLTCWTNYSRYVWAYNACGNSIATIITQSTLPIPFSPAPTAGIHVPYVYQIVWNWNVVSGATGYKWNTTNNFATATDMGTITTRTETGLNCGTAYTRYCWGYNASGYSSSAPLTQTTLTCGDCPQTFTDSRNNKTYNTVGIGNQCWMAQNLNIGSKILNNEEQTNNSIIEKYCWNNDDANCDVYGGLYQWGELVQFVNGASNSTSWNPVPTGNVIGICPSGWHIPTDAEWTVLTNFLGGLNIAGGKMKATGTIEAGTGLWYDPNTGATNESGFTALPAGYRDGSNGAWYSFKGTSIFWCSTEYSASSVWGNFMYFNDANVHRNSHGKTGGFSVRCLKNN